MVGRGCSLQALAVPQALVYRITEVDLCSCISGMWIYVYEGSRQWCMYIEKATSLTYLRDESLDINNTPVPTSVDSHFRPVY